MRTFLYHILNRNFWFWLFYRHWFRHSDGKKHFGEQYLGHTLDETLNKAKELKKENKKLEDKKGRLLLKKKESEEDKVLSFSDYVLALRKIRKNGFYLFLFLAGETYLNYIILEVLTGVAVNPLDALLKSLLAFVVTGIVIIIAEFFIHYLVLLFRKKAERMYKDIALFIFFAAVLVFVEWMIYQFAMLRAADFQGAISSQSAGLALALMSMIMPLAAGFLAHEIAQVLGPFRNTRRLARLDRKIGRIQRKLHANNEEEGKYFLLSCNNRYCVVDEFKVYKDNADMKKKRTTEDASQHFIVSRDTFVAKAKEEYNRSLVETVEVLIPEDFTKASQNGDGTRLINLKHDL